MYKSLEQQIQELWESRGLKVLEEKFEAISNGRFKWTIIAEPITTDWKKFAPPKKEIKL